MTRIFLALFAVGMYGFVNVVLTHVPQHSVSGAFDAVTFVFGLVLAIAATAIPAILVFTPDDFLDHLFN